MDRLFALWLLAGLVFRCPSPVFGAQPAAGIPVSIEFRVGNQILIPGRPSWKSGPDLEIEMLRFYVSEFSLSGKERDTGFHPVAYHLVDLADSTSTRFFVPDSHVKSPSLLRVFFGVDSVSQHLGVQGGDLDPTRGMYWTWQTGYIHLRLEGKFGEKSTPFQFHIGGFSGNQNTGKFLSFPLPPDWKMGLKLVIQLESFLSEALREPPYHLMSPGPEAVRLSRHFQQAITLQGL